MKHLASFSPEVAGFAEK